MEALVGASLRLAAATTVAITVAIAAVLVIGSIEFFTEVSPREFLFDTQWTPLFADKHFGVLPLLLGTLMTTAIGVAVALPVGLGAAIYLSELAPGQRRRWLKPTLEIVAGIPSVVFGFLALALVTPALQKVVPGLEHFNALSAGIVIGIMIVPLFASVAEDAISAVPRSLREAAWGLGAGEARTILRVVLPAARSGIVAGMLLAISRAVGETMIVAMAAGMRSQLSLDPREPIQTMTAYIVQVSLGDTPVGTLEFRTIFAVGGLLFLVTLLLNLAAGALVRRLQVDGGNA